MYFENNVDIEYFNCERKKKLIESSREQLDYYTYIESLRYDCGCFIYVCNDENSGCRNYSVRCKNCKFKEGNNNG